MTISLIGAPGIENTTPSFRTELVRTAAALGIDPDYLATVISFESKFSPTNPNPMSGAVGLIQFTSTAAKEVGTTQAALAQMSAEDQLRYVRRYYALKGFAPGKSQSLEDTYFAVIWPAGRGQSPGTILMQKGSTAPCPGAGKMTLDDCYRQNPGFDTTHKGYITAGDISRKITAHYNAGLANPRVPVVGGPTWPSAPRSGGAAAVIIALGAGAAYLYLKRKRT